MLLFALLCAKIEYGEAENKVDGKIIFDISDIAHPRQVASVQTCRASHTNTLVTSAKDSANVPAPQTHNRPYATPKD